MLVRVKSRRYKTKWLKPSYRSSSERYAIRVARGNTYGKKYLFGGGSERVGVGRVELLETALVRKRGLELRRNHRFFF
jgi:hypothetical protein